MRSVKGYLRHSYDEFYFLNSLEYLSKHVRNTYNFNIVSYAAKTCHVNDRYLFRFFAFFENRFDYSRYYCFWTKFVIDSLSVLSLFLIQNLPLDVFLTDHWNLAQPVDCGWLTGICHTYHQYCGGLYCWYDKVSCVHDLIEWIPVISLVIVLYKILTSFFYFRHKYFLISI